MIRWRLRDSTAGGEIISALSRPASHFTAYELALSSIFGSARRSARDGSTLAASLSDGVAATLTGGAFIYGAAASNTRRKCGKWRHDNQ